jgi:hypothetical protein
MIFESVIDRNSCQPNIHTGLQRIAFGIEPQYRRMPCDSVAQQNHINVVVKVFFLLTRWFVPLQFDGRQKPGYVPRIALFAQAADSATLDTAKFMSRISSEMESRGIPVSQMQVGAIINISSGGCDFESEAEMLDILKSAGMSNCKIWCEDKNAEITFVPRAVNVIVPANSKDTVRSGSI